MLSIHEKLNDLREKEITEIAAIVCNQVDNVACLLGCAVTWVIGCFSGIRTDTFPDK